LENRLSWECNIKIDVKEKWTKIWAGLIWLSRELSFENTSPNLHVLEQGSIY
jgi:hypothetical protein